MLALGGGLACSGIALFVGWPSCLSYIAVLQGRFLGIACRCTELLCCRNCADMLSNLLTCQLFYQPVGPGVCTHVRYHTCGTAQVIGIALSVGWPSYCPAMLLC